MQTFQAREIANMTEEQVWATLDNSRTPCRVVCEDGVVEEYTHKALLLSWHGFRMHRSFPALRVLTRHLFSHKVMNGGTQLETYRYLLWDTFFAIEGKRTPSQIMKHLFAINNDIYNAQVSKMSTHVTTLHALDFAEICGHPESQRIFHENPLTEEGIARAYKEQLALLDKEDEFPNNNLRNSYAASILKNQQMLQNILRRGFLTDGDSNVIPGAVPGSFFRGLGGQGAIMKESRSATKAQLMTYEPVQKTEYFARRLQLVAGVVSRLLRGEGTTLYDCGKTRPYKTVTVTVSKEKWKNYYGNYYEENGELKVIDKECVEKGEIFGKTIQLRNPIGCGHRHEGRVCGTCMGNISWSLEPHENLGHQTTTALCPLITQDVISTKHLDKSATTAILEITPNVVDWLALTTDKTGYRLGSTSKATRWMRIPRASIPYPSDVYDEDRSKCRVDPQNYSSLKAVYIDPDSSCDGVKQKRIPLVSEGSPAFLSREFLDYLKTKPGMRVTDKGDYIVDLKDWDLEKPFVRYPRKHRNTLDYMTEVACLIESTGDSAKLSDYEDESEALAVFSNLVYSKFELNVSHLGVMMLAYSARDPQSDDYSIPTVHERIYFGKRDNIINGRSMSGKLPFEKQFESLIAPTSYTIKDRMSLPMDPIFGG